MEMAREGLLQDGGSGWIWNDMRVGMEEKV